MLLIGDPVAGYVSLYRTREDAVKNFQDPDTLVEIPGTEVSKEVPEGSMGSDPNAVWFVAEDKWKQWLASSSK